MKRTSSCILALFFGFGVALGGDIVSEKQVKELEKMIEEGGIYVETAKKGVVLSGYVDASYTYNLNGGGTDSGFNGTPGTIRTHMFDVDSNDFNVNQVKLALEKALPAENTWAAGFRVDLMFGEDAKYLADNDWGMGDGELAVEQAYVQFRVPVGNGLDFKFGKFVSLLGYEVIETPANLNVSRGYLFTYGIPWMHTGFLMAYKFNDWIDAKIGLVNGWNNSDSNFLDGGWGLLDDDDDDFLGDELDGDDAPSDFAKAITAQIALHAPGGNADLVNSFIYSFEGEDVDGLRNVRNNFEFEGIGAGGGAFFEGDFPEDGTLYLPPTGTENAGIFVWNIWGQWRPIAFNDRLLLAFDAVLGKAYDNLHRSALYINAEEESFNFWDTDENAATWWGIALYAKYQVTDVFSLAVRGEYFHDSDGTARLVDGLVVSTPAYGDLPEGAVNNNADSIDGRGLFVSNTDIWSFTLTAGFDLWENMLMRLEYRLDIVSSDGGGPNPVGIDIPDDDDDFEIDLDLPEDNAFFNNQSTQHTFLLNVSYSF